MMLLKELNNTLSNKREVIDAKTLQQAVEIIEDVRGKGERALRKHAERLGDILPEAKLIFNRDDLMQALNALSPDERALLERTHQRIWDFASAQKASLKEVEIKVPGGVAGHTIAPVERAGCYAPGGRFPLPSSVLMTVATARAAGVAHVMVASPKPTVHTLAAAAVANADALLAVGGAQAIAALAFGTEHIPRCDIIVGPGNRYVTAAKQYVSSDVAIDMLAGPSELLVLTDEHSDVETIAADLLGQAEHDPDAIPGVVVVGNNADFLKRLDKALHDQLVTLPTKETAEAALRNNGWYKCCANLTEAVAFCNDVAPEHLQVMLQDNKQAVEQLKNYGALFIGKHSAEVFGDYGVGPNHVLPTGQSARFKGGLSVFNFLRIRTYLTLDSAPQELVDDAAALARLEGLEAHALAALKRGLN